MMNKRTLEYLNRLGYYEPVTPTVQHLNALQNRHLHRIPFENLDIHLGREIILDRDRIYNKIVLGNRGGFCFEVNSLFQELLEALGYTCYLISCAVFSEVEQAFTIEGGHAAIVVLLNGKRWLVDVGFGDGIQFPVTISGNQSERHNHRYFQVFEMDQQTFQLMKSDDCVKWIPMYRFQDLPVELNYFKPMCYFHQTSLTSPFTQRRICTKLVPNGRITLTGDRIIRTFRDDRQETSIDIQSFDNYLNDLFDMRVNGDWITPSKEPT